MLQDVNYRILLISHVHFHDVLIQIIKGIYLLDSRE